MDDAELEEIRQRWLDEVMANDDEIDEYADHEFDTLLLGFLLGAGVPIGQARAVVGEAPSERWPI